MPTKRVTLDTVMPIEKAYPILLDLCKELSKGKEWKNFFNIRDNFLKSGNWWVQSKNNDRHVIKLWFKRYDTNTIYVTASLSPLKSGGTIAIIDAKVIALLDLFGKRAIPLEIITSKFCERFELAEKE